MAIEAKVTSNQITATVGETKIDVAVGGGVGPTGSSGVVTVAAPLVNGGSSTAAQLSLSVGAGLQVSGGALALASHTHTASQISDFTSAVIAAAPPTTSASLLTSGTLPDARLSANIARTSDITSAVNALVDSAPGALDTLNELAAALGDDANFASTVTNALAGKAAASHTHGGGDITIGDGDDNTAVLSDGSRAAVFLFTLNDANYIDGLELLLSDTGGVVPDTYLPTATANALGAVKIGSGVTITDGVISVSTNYAPASHTHEQLDQLTLTGDTSFNLLLGGDIEANAILLDGTDLATTLSGKAALSHAHTAADITDFSSAVASASPEEVVECAATTNFPGTGNTSLLYIATDSSRFYRWTGSEYVEVGPVALYPAAHTHAASDITSGTISPARLPITSGTAAPTGGADGDIYLQYTA